MGDEYAAAHAPLLAARLLPRLLGKSFDDILPCLGNSGAARVAIEKLFMLMCFASTCAGNCRSRKEEDCNDGRLPCGHVVTGHAGV